MAFLPLTNDFLPLILSATYFHEDEEGTPDFFRETAFGESCQRMDVFPLQSDE